MMFKSILRFIGEIFVDWKDSFNNEKRGFSGRKEAAFGAFVISAIISVKFTTADNLESVLTLWLIYSLLCLGIITTQQVLELRNRKEPNKVEEPKIQ